jgi:hypothetical protein
MGVKLAKSHQEERVLTTAVSTSVTSLSKCLHSKESSSRTQLSQFKKQGPDYKWKCFIAPNRNCRNIERSDRTLHIGYVPQVQDHRSYRCAILWYIVMIALNNKAR